MERERERIGKEIEIKEKEMDRKEKKSWKRKRQSVHLYTYQKWYSEISRKLNHLIYLSIYLSGKKIIIC